MLNTCTLFDTVESLTGITADMLKDEEPLSIILPKFFS